MRADLAGRDIAGCLRFLTGGWSTLGDGNSFTEETWSTHQADSMVGWRRTIDDDLGATTVVEFFRIFIKYEGATLEIFAPPRGQLTLPLARLRDAREGHRAVFETSKDSTQRIVYWLDDGWLCRMRQDGAVTAVDKMQLLSID
jgi:hypothetical protein